ncbi:serine/threonine protein kinase [Venturia nashicola]|nr:serine/threonine protein kinase [Venturia nashicola]
MANIFSPSENSCPGQQQPGLRHNMTSPSMHVFPTDNFDYELSKEKSLGSGRWSTVYLAKSVMVSTNPWADMITPPTTPTRSRRSNSFPRSRPEFYAVKVAANRSSIKALKEEATILSRLSLFSGYEKHIVPFHGYDTRNDSIVFSALPASLEDLVHNQLSRLDEASRVTKMASIFPRIAKSLTSSLAWLHAANVVHADMKPANILLRPDLPVSSGTALLDVSFTPVLADFTSSFRSDVDSTSSPASAMGGGTYDFLSPELLTRPYPPPSAASDVYALAITLLEIIIGTSPYAAAQGNRFQLLEMAKAGRAIDFAMQNPQSETRLRNTADEIRRATGLDVIDLLNCGLEKSPDARISARVWCTMF